MKFLRKILDKQKPKFEKGGKFSVLHSVFDGFETFLFVPKHTTPEKGAQVRDAIDMKRLMITVVVAMVPCLLFGIWNAGHQHFLALGEQADFLAKILYGSKVVLPIVFVAYAVGLGIEFVFAQRRGHAINEGYLVSGMLIPLIMPVTIPLWQVALASAFAVIIAKEVFGGTGMNILNIAMTARAFLYFAYPTNMAGDFKVWTQYDQSDKIVAERVENVQKLDGYTRATALGLAAEKSSALEAQIQTAREKYVDNKVKAAEAKGKIANPVAFNAKAFEEADNLPEVKDLKAKIPNQVEAAFQSTKDGLYSFKSFVIGTIPGSIGETSFLMCIIGALILILTGVGSWKIIVSAFGGAYLIGLLFNAIGGNAYMAMPAHYHLVMGGLAFGIVFMATDPVTAAQTEMGKWVYGFLIGALTVLIRVFNPAYPEGIMLVVLLMNVFAPLIDYYVVAANKKRRLKRLELKQA